MKIPAERHKTPFSFLIIDPPAIGVENCERLITEFYEKWGDTHVIDVEHKMTASGTHSIVLRALCIVRFIDGQKIIGRSGVRTQIAQSEEAEAYNRTKPALAVAGPPQQGKPGPRSMRDM